MNNIYEQFNCKSKEELYEKVKNKDIEVQPLLDFLDFAKTGIKNKNKAIKSPDTFVEYVKSTTLPTKDAGTIIFVNNKNKPVHLKRTRLSRKSELRETLKEGLLSGGTRAFLAFSFETPDKRIGDIKSFFETIGMKIIDTLGYEKDEDIFISETAGRSQYSSNTFELVNDNNDEYTEEDFSLQDKYADFSSHFATNEIMGLNVISDVENIKEILKIGYQHNHQEIFGMIAYDSDENIIFAEELFKGTTESSIVDFKIMARALLQLEDLKGMVVFHNHPSGNPEPSREDISMTGKVKNMSEMLGIELLDHFIVGKEKTLSFSEELDYFQSGNLRYQNEVGNIRNVGEEKEYYKDKIEGLKVGDRIKTAISNETLVLDVKGENALLFNGRQFVEAYGIQNNQENYFWNQGYYHDSLPKELFGDYRKKPIDVESMENIINNHYEDFVKALISIEKGIEDENVLDDLYDRFMDNDGVNLINDYFDDVMYDLEQENAVGEAVKIKEKPESILEELKKNKVKIDSKNLKKEKEIDIVSL
jgi:DNA repair protein RadC